MNNPHNLLGHPTHVQLGGGVCVPLHTNSFYGSVQTYGACVVLFTYYNCTKIRSSSIVVGKHISADYYRNLMTTNLGIRFRLASIRLCTEEEERGEVSKYGEHSTEGEVPLSVLAIIFMAIAILTCFSALAGAVIAQYYEKVKIRSNTEPYNVVYQMQS